MTHESCGFTKCIYCPYARHPINESVVEDEEGNIFIDLEDKPIICTKNMSEIPVSMLEEALTT